MESLVTDICSGLLHGLSYMHQQGIAHLDLQPENILAIDKGVAPQMKIVDFSNAAHIGPRRPPCILEAAQVNIEFSGMNN